MKKPGLLITALFSLITLRAQVELGCTSNLNDNFSCFPGLAYQATQSDSLEIPTTHGIQLLLQEGDSLPSGEISGSLNDFTAYFPINGSSRHGYLTIHHESYSGKISLLEIMFDSLSNSWKIVDGQLIQYNSSDIVGISRPCSGGISPWGTLFTAEERANYTNDANGDGYHDYGWILEVDPTSGEVVDYENDGVQDKLWALGKMAHENIAFANDSVGYFGSDQSAGFLYKFIADTAQKFNSGKLYALRLGNLNQLAGNISVPANGEWIPIPNDTQSDRNNCIPLSSTLGATNFNFIEDVDINPISGEVYFATKSQNSPGGVYSFTDGDSSVSNFKIVLKNNYAYTVEDPSGTSQATLLSGADNLTFDNQANLYVLQDGGESSQVWFVRNDHQHQLNEKVAIFMHTPSGSEPTGLTFTPDNRYGFMSIQHPASNYTQIDHTGQPIQWNKSTSFVISRKAFTGLNVKVNLGISINQQLYFQNDTFYFSPLAIQASKAIHLDLFNSGTENLFISDISMSGDPEFVMYPDSSYFITPLDTFTFLVGYDPNLPGTYNATISFTSNDSVYPRLLHLNGSAFDQADVDMYEQNRLTIYPNPVSTTLHILSKNSGTFSIYSMEGKLLSRSSIQEGNNAVDVSFLERGSYVAIYETASFSYQFQFVKE